MDLTTWISVYTVLIAGATLQGSVGFGLGLLAAPLLVLIRPELIPGPLILCGMTMGMLILLREGRSVHLRGLGLALGGRIPGAYLGAMALTAVPSDKVGVLIGSVVLLAVITSIPRRHQLPVRSWMLFAAGSASGFTGTLTSVGGPLIALVYRDAPPQRLRSTLSGFFFLGGLISLASLAHHGAFGWTHIHLYLRLLPAVFLGFLISLFTVRFLDRGLTRLAIMLASAASAIVCMLRSLL